MNSKVTQNIKKIFILLFVLGLTGIHTIAADEGQKDTKDEQTKDAKKEDKKDSKETKKDESKSTEDSPWYKQWWAIALLIVLLVGIAFAIYYFVFRKEDEE